MERFTRMNEIDSRGEIFLKNRDYLDQISNQPVYFEVSNLDINTEHRDFGGYLIQDKFYFLSNRRKSLAINRSYSWTGAGFLDYYEVDATGSISSNDIRRLKKSANSKYHEGPMCISQNGKSIYFTRNNVSKGKERKDVQGVQNLKLFLADLDDKSNFTNVRELNINSKEYSVGHPTISADGKTLYFASDMPGGYGGADIYKAIINEDGTLGTPENLGRQVNTSGQELFPWFGSNGILYFASDGHVGLGGLDVYALIMRENGKMRKIVNLGEPVNSKNDDFALVLNGDGKGYVSSNREGGMGSDDIYAIQVLNEIESGILLAGTVKDYETGEILAGSMVRLNDTDGRSIGSVLTDENGEYVFNLEPSNNYNIIVDKSNYRKDERTVSTKNMIGGNDLVEHIELHKSAKINLNVLVSDAFTGEFLDGVKVVLIDNITGDRNEFVTSKTGAYLKGLYDLNIGDKGDYTVELRKQGFTHRIVKYKTVFDQGGTYSLQAVMERTMILANAQSEINAIYFDLNSAKLRDVSKEELDRIVKLMNDFKELRIELGSHTDCRQTERYNLLLSERRARNSANYIKKRISNPERVTYKGYGENRLINHCGCEGENSSNCSESEHQKNRRTEFKILNPDTFNIKNNSPQSF